MRGRMSKVGGTSMPQASRTAKYVPSPPPSPNPWAAPEEALGAGDALLAVPVGGAGVSENLDPRERVDHVVEPVQARLGEEAAGDTLDDGAASLDAGPLRFGQATV